MPILIYSDFKQIKDWLEENLTAKKSFVPHLDSIPNINSKGIYFWFMKPEGYNALSNYVSIQPIEPKLVKEIDSVKYDLVYIGTTGTGKKGISTLTKRLDWHINQKHKESSIKQKQSALSTLRTGLSSLLSEDLVLPNTEELVNDFMCSNMIVYYQEYPNNKELIDNDEKLLIYKLKPLLNLKSNPNSLKNSDLNPTKKYKYRRILVEKNTKKRLGL
jgi:hypothetical protein